MLKCKKGLLLVLVWYLLGSTWVLTACTSGEKNTDSTTSSRYDYESFKNDLAEKGAQVEEKDGFYSQILHSDGQVLSIGGLDVNTFQYSDENAAENIAGTISSDGSQIGFSMIDWAGAPHFYLKGTLIVQYLGEDDHVIALLNDVLGGQFAGMNN